MIFYVKLIILINVKIFARKDIAMKKFIALFLALIVCVGVAACNTKPAGESTTTTTVITPTETTTDKGSSQTETTATTDITTETTSTTTPVDPEITTENDPVTITVGKYVSVMYNPAYCEVTGNAKAGVGSKETVTLSIKMKDGYIFDGWSIDKALINGAELSEASTTYSFTTSKEAKIIPNYSVKVIYDANGGKAANGTNTVEQTFSVVWYKCPMTLPEQGYFTREGYTLSEYNTKPDGSGTAISLGSRVYMDDKPTATLYCIWEKQSPEADFEYTVSNGKTTLKKYKGTDDTVVIPDKLGGFAVNKIAGGAFEDATCTKVILPATVREVEDSAFTFSDIESIVFFDSLVNISDRAFDNGQLKHMRINSALGIFNHWSQIQATTKVDRLVYATGKGLRKMVIYGGSGALHGLDCAQIDEALDGKYYIINMGSNAQVSAAAYFEWFNTLVTDKDIVLWMPENGNYMLGDTRFDYRLFGATCGHYDAFKNIDLTNYSGVLSAYRSYASQHMTSDQPLTDVFSDSYDKYGDLITPRKSNGNAYTYNFWVDPTQYKHMSSLISEMVSNGTKVYFTYAVMDGSSESITDELFDGYKEKLIAAFPDMVIISDYKNCLVDNEYMYNSEWHLTWEGAVVRTRQLVPDILAQLAKEEK